MNTLKQEEHVSLLDLTNATIIIIIIITVHFVRLVRRPRKGNLLLLLRCERPAGKHNLQVNAQLQLWNNDQGDEESQCTLLTTVTDYIWIGCVLPLID